MVELMWLKLMTSQPTNNQGILQINEGQGHHLHSKYLLFVLLKKSQRPDTLRSRLLPKRKKDDYSKQDN